MAIVNRTKGLVASVAGAGATLHSVPMPIPKSNRAETAGVASPSDKPHRTGPRQRRVTQIHARGVGRMKDGLGAGQAGQGGGPVATTGKYADIEAALSYLSGVAAAQRIVVPLLNELAVARDALAAGGAVNTYATSVQAQLDNCTKKQTGGTGTTLSADGTTSSNKTVSTVGAAGIGAGGLAVGATAGFLVGRMMKR